MLERELLLPKAFPAAAGTGSAWEGFRETYILINECAFTFAFCSLFLAVGDSSFPPGSQTWNKETLGWFLFLSLR